MSFAALLWAVRWRLSPRNKLVLIHLANRLNGKDDLCNPSIKTLAADTGLSERSVQLAISDLVSVGAIAIVANRRGGRGLSPQYHFSVVSGTTPIYPEKDVIVTRRNYEKRAQDKYLKSHQKSANPDVKECRFEGKWVQNPLEKGAGFVPSNIDEPENEPKSESEREPVLRFAHDRTANGSLFPEELAVEKVDPIEVEFQSWWALVPKKVDKLDASKLFRTARMKKRVTFAALFDAMERYQRLYAPYTAVEVGFSTGPAKWLRGEKWNDEVPQSVATVRANLETDEMNGGGLMGAAARMYQRLDEAETKQ